MDKGIIHHMNIREILRVEVDLSRECLRRTEDSIETGQFLEAEAMTVRAIIHLKHMLKKLNEYNDHQVPTSQWIL